MALATVAAMSSPSATSHKNVEMPAFSSAILSALASSMASPNRSEINTWCAIAARRLPLSMMAFLQYLAPSIAFLIGVLVYHEPLDPQRMLSLAAIWSGLAVYSVDLLKAAAARPGPALP